IRKQRCCYTLPAHSALVADVRYSRTSGEVLVSASFDSTAKVWSTRDWSLLRTLSGHEGKASVLNTWGCCRVFDVGKPHGCVIGR
ncbi:unnamed protein product, partial [Ectocarpus sp. 4 AP-2014]